MTNFEKQKSTLFRRMLFLLTLMLVGSNVSWGQLLPTTRYDLSNVGTNSFALVNLSERKAIYGTGEQNLAYGSYSDAFADEETCFEFKLEEANGHYLLHAYLHNGNEYSIWGGANRYLNSQPDGSSNVSFILGLNNQYGQDAENCALWDLESDGNGGYKLKNVGTGKYLNDNKAALNDEGVSWSLCSVGSGCKVEFNATDGSMGSVTATVNGNTINSGDYVAYGTQVVLTATPNAGYVFKKWSNDETTPTRTWTVTGSGHPTATFEAGYTVTFGPNKSGWGTVTATVNGQTITSGTAVASGTQVQFTATPASSDYLSWGWKVDGEDNWSFPNPYTVTKNVTITHKFTRGYKISAVASNGEYGSVVATNGSQNGNDIHVTPWPSGGVTFKATPKSGCSLVGWYYDVNCSNQVTATTNVTVDGNNVTFAGDYFGDIDSETSKSNTFTLWAKFQDDTKYVTADLYCNHYVDGEGNTHSGSNNLGAHTLNASSNVESSSYDGTNYKFTITTGAAGGYAYYKFNNKKNFSDLKGWNIGVDVTANVSNIAFFKDDQKISDYWQDPTSRNNLTVDQNAFKEVDEIRIYLYNNTTTVFSSASFNFEHADRVKPVLSEGTATDMKAFVNENLILANGSGFWRQYTDNTYTSVKSDEFIHTNEWEKRYEIPASSLTVNADYYFRVVDANTCALGYSHSSEAVDVHVKVVPAIHSINVNGTTRHYDVYAPENISGSVGVVVSLHGASNDYDDGRVDFDEIANQNWKDDNKKFVVVYPRGLMRNLRGGTERGWESYTENNTEDVDFFKAIVNNLNQEFNGQFSVDMNRVYLAGFSNGGMMAYKAAHQAGDFFKAFASVGGYPVNESHLFHAGKQPTPFIHIQGKADGIFPNSTYPLDVIAHNMVYRNGAKFNPWKDDAYEKQDGEMITSPKDGENNDIIEKDCHAALPGGAAFYMYKVAGMGHTWKYDWDNDANHTDDVAATIWKFFNKEGIVNAVDPTLKFRFDDSEFWGLAGTVGFDDVNSGTSVLSYGGRTKTDNAGATYDKDSNNKNLYHTLQFDGGTFGAPHYMKLQVYTELVQTEDPNQYFVVELTKTGDSKSVFRKRYQAGRGEKPLYINFTAQSYFNEYKLTITKSSSDLGVTVKGVEFHSGSCQDVGAEENPVFFQDVASVLMGMNPIYQPVYDQSYDDLAKEYLPIADIPVHEENVAVNNRILADDLHYTNGTTTTYLRNVGSGVLPSTLVDSWDGSGKATVTKNQIFNLAHSGKTGEDLDHKLKNAFIAIPVGMTYTVDKTKGINISQHGKANMPAYIAGDKDDFPDHGMIAFKVQGTLDFTVLAVNDIEYNPASVADESRRKLRVYYVNDQMNGKPAELQNWDFYGERSEQHHTNLNALEMNIRLPQLGKDGTCTVFISYEGTKYEAEAADDKVWIKGIVIKRPDLKVTIGRTDNLYTDKYYDDSAKPENQREHNTFLTPYGENKPYVWSFKDAGFKNTNSVDLNLKKINEKDGRTYVCGKYVNPETSAVTQLVDHLLVYSDINSSDNNDKVQFDGRVAGQEHIEFRNASRYNIPEATDSRTIFDPIQANGLKVNVTGSGWFKIRCSAPNGPVNMKVYSSTNYGAAYINLLREFRVEKTASETDWQEYTVYLKGHINRITEPEKPADQRRPQEGFWDGEPANAWDNQEKAEEVLRMSLFVVFDAITGETYPDEDGNHPQLNIHELSWLNEKPADYVFQREEDPKLLTTWQEIKRGGNTVLWWKAANDDDAKYPVLKENGNNAYNRLGQTTTSIAGGKGEKSPENYVSTTATWDDGTSYDAYWDIAAATTTNAHTEAAYGKTGEKNAASEYKHKNAGNTEFDLPVSGSFLRLCAMQNTYVIAHVLPGADGAKIYVLDETGSPIPTSAGTEADKKRLGYIAAMSNVTNSGGENMTTDGTVRIELAVNAGKEYFICADGAPVSLARLEVKDDQYNPTKNSTLELVDNADNTSAIGTPYSNEQFYCDANLKRKPASGNWFSLVLPFSMNEKMFEQVFGVGSKCVHFTDVDKETNTIKLTHHYYNMIVAGRPVFVYATNTFSAEKINFNDVTLQAKEVKTTTTDSGFEFFASYKNETMKKNDLYMNNANAINYLTVANATYPGMRSFIKNNCNYDFSTGVTTSMGAKALFLNFNDEGVEDATGIEALISSEFGQNAMVVTKSTKVYDLNGRVVANGTDISNLPSGVYIVNGKKYVK